MPFRCSLCCWQDKVTALPYARHPTGVYAFVLVRVQLSSSFYPIACPLVSSPFDIFLALLLPARLGSPALQYFRLRRTAEAEGILRRYHQTLAGWYLPPSRQTLCLFRRPAGGCCADSRSSDLSLADGGSFYLPYRHHYSQEQLLAAYPSFSYGFIILHWCFHFSNPCCALTL